MQALGFNEVNDDKSISTGTVSSSAITTAHDIKINDVGIGVSATASAASKALAINEKTGEHGVTASASNRVELQLDFDNVPSAATKTFDLTNQVTGKTVVFKDGNSIYQQDLILVANTVSELVTKINAGTNSYTASASDKKLIINAGARKIPLTLMQA